MGLFDRFKKTVQDAAGEAVQSAQEALTSNISDAVQNTVGQALNPLEQVPGGQAVAGAVQEGTGTAVEGTLTNVTEAVSSRATSEASSQAPDTSPAPATVPATGTSDTSTGQ